MKKFMTTFAFVVLATSSLSSAFAGNCVCQWAGEGNQYKLMIRGEEDSVYYDSEACEYAKSNRSVCDIDRGGYGEGNGW